VIADANLLFDEAFWQQTPAMAGSAHEARPLIAARAGRADCLLRLGQLEQARDEYLALLALCRADEPACRHPSPPSMPAREWDALQQLLVRFDEASCWLLYNKA
jgi:hypothetical protein